MAKKKHLFERMVYAPRKAYIERGVELPYPDYRVLLGALAVRDRPDGVTFMWALTREKGGGRQAFLRLHRPNEHIRMELSVPEMVRLARQNPQDLYEYLHTCTTLLKSRCKSE